MSDKLSTPSVKPLKDAYFSAADKAITSHGLSDTSAESFRKLLAKGEKTDKAKNSKAAS